MVESIKTVLMRRDGITELEADLLIQDAKDDLADRLLHPQEYDDISTVCADHFGLEEDYLFELMDIV